MGVGGGVNEYSHKWFNRTNDFQTGKFYSLTLIALKNSNRPLTKSKHSFRCVERETKCVANDAAVNHPSSQKKNHNHGRASECKLSLRRLGENGFSFAKKIFRSTRDKLRSLRGGTCSMQNSSIQLDHV